MNTSSENCRTILVVDDDASVLVLIQAILTAAGYRVLLATESEGAIRLASQKHLHIDMAMLDVHIPGVEGTALADQILALRPEVPVLWISGFVDDEFIRIKLLDGYAGFLPKPLRRNDLIAAVQQILSEDKILTATALAQ